MNNVQRFLLGGAGHGLSARAPLPGSAPVSEKRVGLSRGPRPHGYGCLMAQPWLETDAIEAFPPVGIVRDANQAFPSCRQGLDLTSRAGCFHPNRVRSPSVGNPISRAVRLRTMETSGLAHDVSGTGRQIPGRTMQPITTMMPVRQCGHSCNDFPVSTS
jgi:hypothetical protein